VSGIEGEGVIEGGLHFNQFLIEWGADRRGGVHVSQFSIEGVPCW